MILKFLNQHKTLVCLILVITLSFFLRFHQLNEIYVFNLDEEYQAFYAWQQVLDPHPIWIGLIASSLEFYLGPYLVYLTAILLAISSGDPIINGYFAAFLGVITTAVIFYTGKRLFNLTVGVIAALLYASLPLFVFFDQKYWNNMPLPLITILMFLSLNLVKNSKWWWVLFAGLVGLIFETHLPPLPLAFIGFMFFLKGKYFKDLKLVSFCFLAFLIFYWPLIVFDLNHDFSNLKVFTRVYEKTDSTTPLNPQAKFNTLFDSLGRFWYLKSGMPNADEINFGCSPLSLSTGYETIGKYTNRTFSPFWLSLVSLGLLGYFLFQNLTSKIFAHKSLAIFLTTLFGFYLIFPGGAFEYYLLIFLTLFCFVPAILISQLKGKFQLISFIPIMIVILLGLNTVLATSGEFSLGPKKRLISRVMDLVGEKPFAIEGRGICHNFEGWRYLFKVYGRTPNQSYTDKSFSWLYPSDAVNIPFEVTVILSEDRIPLSEDLSNLQSLKEGGYRAYIKYEQRTNKDSILK